MELDTTANITAWDNCIVSISREHVLNILQEHLHMKMKIFQKAMGRFYRHPGDFLCILVTGTDTKIHHYSLHRSLFAAMEIYIYI